MAKIEQWHRRHALMIASQLPDGQDDALAVLVTLIRDCQDLSA
jgi:hypothetical protein